MNAAEAAREVARSYRMSAALRDYPEATAHELLAEAFTAFAERLETDPA